MGSFELKQHNASIQCFTQLTIHFLIKLGILRHLVFLQRRLALTKRCTNCELPSSTCPSFAVKRGHSGSRPDTTSCHMRPHSWVPLLGLLFRSGWLPLKDNGGALQQSVGHLAVKRASEPEGPTVAAAPPPLGSSISRPLASRSLLQTLISRVEQIKLCSCREKNKSHLTRRLPHNHRHLLCLW